MKQIGKFNLLPKVPKKIHIQFDVARNFLCTLIMCIDS